MRELVERWRYQAQSAVSHYEGGTLLRCADELEKVHHDEQHGSAFEPGCPVCDRERARQDFDES
jgi:hypothetical protein